MDRLEKYSEFNKFADSASEAFATLCGESDNSQAFKKSHSFYALKGGAMGGTDKRIVEVFFGSRAIDQVDTFTSQGSGLPTRSRKLLAERGASLLYERTDAGNVVCILRPAATEDMRHEEDSIVLEWIDEPSALNKDRKVRAHWRSLLSYMECTCVDGSPSHTDRWRVGWLRFSRRLVKDGRQNSTRLNFALLEIFKFSLTIGLSGFLLNLLAALNSSNDTNKVTAVRDRLAIEAAETRGEISADRERIKALEVQVAAYRDKLAAIAVSLDTLKLEASMDSEKKPTSGRASSGGSHGQSK